MRALGLNAVCHLRQPLNPIAAFVPVRPLVGNARRLVAAWSVQVWSIQSMSDPLTSPWSILKLTLDAAPFPVAVFDVEGRATLWNHAARDLSGYSNEDLPTLSSLVALLRPQEVEKVSIAPRLASALSQSRERRQASPIGDVELTCRDGRVILVEAIALEVEGYSIFYLHDLTEHRRALEALRESEERLAAAFSALPEALSITSTKTDRYVLVNEGFCRITGHAKADTIGKTQRDLAIWVNPLDRQTVTNQLLAHGAVANFEAPFQRLDGKKFTGLVSGRTILVGGETYLLTITRDVTRERELEERIHQSQRLESVGRLAGGVAHDFNNLLTCIIGNLEQVLEGLPPDAAIRSDVQATMAASERAAAATRQLLAFGRRQVLTPEQLSLNRVVERSSQLLRRLLGEDIEIRMVLAPDLHLIRADALQLEQIILNLAVNARDAMPRGGKLTLETTNVTLSQEYASQHVAVNPGPHIRLTVTDNGSGMADEVKQHIFEPFFTTKELGKGSGLGLATVYGIVSQSGGHISVYSELDVGTSFSIYFPRDDAEVCSRSAPPSVAAPASGHEAILVVEDDVQVRSLIRRVLTKAGYKVFVAENGLAAIELWRGRTETIHLLVTDVVMPQMSGRQLADYLNATQPQLKVLYMSGFTDDALGHHGVLEPGTPFLPKPFTSEQLKKKVRAVLDG